MNILIIGCKGFIGSHCAASLGKEHVVHGCDIVECSDEHYFKIDTAADFNKIIATNSYDLFINASGSPGVGFSNQFPVLDYELNTGNVQLLLDAIVGSSSRGKFINFSSAAVYGNPSGLPVTEEMIPAPLSPYGEHKLKAEQLLSQYSKEHGLQTCSLRVFSAYGPELRKQLFWDIYNKGFNGAAIRLSGTGNESRDFIFIADLVQAVECIMKNAVFQGEVINVASGIETTISKAAQTFIDVAGFHSKLIFSGEERQGDPLNWKADISKLSALGFVPAFSLEEGLKLTAESYSA